MTRLRAGLQWGIALTIGGTLLVYIPTSAYVGFIWTWEVSDYGFLLLRLIALVVNALKALVTLPFQETELFLIVVVNSILLFFPVGFYWRVTRSEHYEWRHHHEPGWPLGLAFLWVMVCAAEFFVAAIGGRWFGSVLEYWTWNLGRVIFFLSGFIFWGLYNFSLRFWYRGKMDRIQRNQDLWLAAKDGWYERAAAATNREQGFAAVDELYEYSHFARPFMDEHIKQGFGISEEATDALIKAWATDRKEYPLLFSPDYRFPPPDLPQD